MRTNLMQLHFSSVFMSELLNNGIKTTNSVNASIKLKTRVLPPTSERALRPCKSRSTAEGFRRGKLIFFLETFKRLYLAMTHCSQLFTTANVLMRSMPKVTLFEIAKSSSDSCVCQQIILVVKIINKIGDLYFLHNQLLEPCSRYSFKCFVLL